MCGSCEGASHPGGKRWTSSHLIVIALIGTLVALSVAGLVVRLSSRGAAAASRCSHLVADSTTYQATVTSHYADGAKTLLADTSAFVDHVRAEGEADCAALRALATDSRTTLAAVCLPCAARLARTEAARPG